MRGSTRKTDCPQFKADRLKVNDHSHVGELTTDQEKVCCTVGVLLTCEINGQTYGLFNITQRGSKVAYELPSEKRTEADQGPLTLAMCVVRSLTDLDLLSLDLTNVLWFAPGKYVLYHLLVSEEDIEDEDDDCELVNLRSLNEDNTHRHTLHAMSVDPKLAEFLGGKTKSQPNEHNLNTLTW
jgi:hypothetical protein